MWYYIRRWGISAVGSAQHWQCWGQGFESPMLHQKEKARRSRAFSFWWSIGLDKKPASCETDSNRSANTAQEISSPLRALTRNCCAEKFRRNFSAPNPLCSDEKPASIACARESIFFLICSARHCIIELYQLYGGKIWILAKK